MSARSRNGRWVATIVQRPVNFALPGPCSRNDATPRPRPRCRTPRRTRRLRGRDRRRAAGRARRRSTRLARPIATTAPLRRARPAHCSVAWTHLVVRHDPVDEADRERFVGAHLPAAPDQLLGAGRADEPRQPLRAAGAGDDAEQDLGLTDARASRTRPAGRTPSRARGRRRARSRGSRRSPAAGSPRSRRTPRGTRHRYGARSPESPNSSMSAPAANAFSLPGDDDRLHRRVGGELARDVAQRAEHRLRQRVHRRTVELHHDDAVARARSVVTYASAMPRHTTERAGNSTSAPTGTKPAGERPRAATPRCPARPAPTAARPPGTRPRAAADEPAAEPAAARVGRDLERRSPSGRTDPRPTIEHTAPRRRCAAHARRRRGSAGPGRHADDSASSSRTSHVGRTRSRADRREHRVERRRLARRAARRATDRNAADIGTREVAGRHARRDLVGIDRRPRARSGR